MADDKIDPIRRDVKAMMHHLNGMLDSLDDSTIPDDDVREQVYATILDRFQEANRIENALALLAQAAVRRVAPDRETLAEIIWRSDLDYTPDLDAWSKLTESHRDEYRANADAVLAVLIPADQVRAEALEAAADKLTEITFIGSANWLRARAAEYRKVAGA